MIKTGPYKSILQRMYSPELLSLFVVLLVFLSTGTVFYHFTEDWGWFDSLYFSAMTITTVGYGDLTPSTVLSKAFTMIYVFAGLGIVLAFVQTVAHQSKTKSLFSKVIKNN